MSQSIIPHKLSSLVKDIDKTFWNGDADLKIRLESFIRTLTDNPNITFRDLKKDYEDKGILFTGINFKLDPDHLLRLGEARGGTTGFSVSINVDAEVGAWLHLIVSDKGLKNLDKDKFSYMQKFLSKHTELSDSQSMVVLSFDGKIDTGLAASQIFSPPGGINVGLKFGAGAGYNWFYCRPVSVDTKVLESIGETFTHARLPQTDLKKVLEFRNPIQFEKNELLYSRYIGFVNLGVDSSLGFEFNGTKNVGIGKMDLTTKLAVQVAAKANIAYHLAGAFQVLVKPGFDSDWIRIILDKDRSSGFDFGFGVKVGADLKTTGLPEEDETGLALIESILGTTTPQAFREVLEVAKMAPDELRDKANGFVKEIIGKWVGKAFDDISDELESVLASIRSIENLFDSVDDRLISIYESFLGTIDFEDTINRIKSIINEADDLRPKMLLAKITDSKPRQFLELLCNECFSDIYLNLGIEELRDTIVDKIRDSVENFEKLISGDVKDMIRKFVKAKQDALGIKDMMEELAKLDTVEKLEKQASDRIKELIGRLLDESFDKLLGDNKLGNVIDELNNLANGFSNTLKKIHQTFKKALNAKGRVQISYAYQNVKSNENLIDIEVNVGTTDDPEFTGIELYNKAIKGDWGEVLTDEHLTRIRINKARFTDELRKTKTLNAHIFGWDYKSVSLILSDLDRSIQVGPNGLMTIFKMTFVENRKDESDFRATELNYMLQVSGVVSGAMRTGRMLKREEQDAKDCLQTLQNSFKYKIEDDLTDLDDLSSYFDIGVKLNIINTSQKTKLIETVSQLRGAGMDNKDFGKVGIKYSVSFDGEALANAFLHDYSNEEVAWWSNGKKVKKVFGNNRLALQAMYVDRLISSFYLHSKGNSAYNAIPVLFMAGFHEALNKQPSLNVRKWARDYYVERGNKKIKVNVPQARAQWATCHYHVNVSMSKLIDKFRLKLEQNSKLSVKEMRKFLREVLENLSKMGRKEGSSQPSLPLMLLDEMIQRSAGESYKEACTALLEITLYTPDGKKELQYIPISG